MLGILVRRSLVFYSNMNNFIPLLLITFLIAISCKQNSYTAHGNTDAWWTEDDRSSLIAGLNRTTSELHAEIADLTAVQWNFRETRERWSIGEIVEHLEMQNQLHYREISVTSKAPQHLEFRAITQGQDSHFSQYSTDTTRSKAQWFLEPRGRYPSRDAGWSAFHKARSELTLFVEQTGIDLRKQFTFRAPVAQKEISEIRIGEVRDLHQLVLTGIAHTDRHLTQIRTIKRHPDYPRATGTPAK